MFVGFGFVSGVYSVFVSTFLFKSRLSHFDSLGRSVGRIGGMHYPLCKARSMLGVLFSFFVVTASFDPAVAVCTGACSRQSFSYQRHFLVGQTFLPYLCVSQEEP